MIPYVQLQVHALKVFCVNEKRSPLETSSVKQALEHMVHAGVVISSQSTMRQIHKTAAHFEACEEEASRQSIFSSL